MLVRQARAVAADWVHEHEGVRPDFRGAFLTGSATELSLESALPVTSDVDIVVVLTGADTPMKRGKFRHRGILLEVTYLLWERLEDADEVARSYVLAAGLSTDSVISDPTGGLRQLQRHVRSRFAEPAQIRVRLDNVTDKIVVGLAAVDGLDPWHDQVTSWMFPVSVTTHVVLVAARQNPTVRLRYLRARTTLAQHGQSAFYPELLALLGCAEVRPSLVQRQLNQLKAVFDLTAAVAHTPFFFSSDISAEARPIALHGSQDLIDAGNHREAVFWIIATFARCQLILAADAPELAQDLEPRFREAAAELLQVSVPADLSRRSDQVREFLPRLRATAETILPVEPPDVFKSKLQVLGEP